MKNKTHVCIVNLDNLQYLKNCISDLLKQDASFDCTIIDQNSSEPALNEYYEELTVQHPFINIKRNSTNEPLNHMWNWFHENHDNEYLCYLNNDVRIPTNFISDSEKIFELEKDVAVTFHSTNHPKYFKKTELSYQIYERGVQGWDYTIRNECYHAIPSQLKVYAGDYYLYHEIYITQQKKSACISSSPILHYQGITGHRPEILNKRQAPKDGREYAALGIASCGKYPAEYSIVKPTKIVEQTWLKHHAIN